MAGAFSRPLGRPYSLALASLLLIAANRPPELEGELLLDAAAPHVEVLVAGQKLRLRVDPQQWGTIELNPGAAARLPLTFQDGNDAMVGRTRLVGRAAPAALEIGGRRTQVTVVEHGRDTVADADGLIGPDLLPFALIRWQRRDAPPSSGRRTFVLDYDLDSGLGGVDPAMPPDVRLHFSLVLPTSYATAAAGAELARRHGGRFTGPAAPVATPFNLTRPARPLGFTKPPLIGGFRFDQLEVRTGDFRGNNALPADEEQEEAGDIVVARREAPQVAIPWVTLATDRLSRCAEITFSAAPRTMTLACAFDRAAR